MLQKGQNFSLTCKAKFAVELKQQDIPEEITTINMKVRNELIADGEYKFRTVLELYNVDQYTVGFYACYDKRINIKNVLNNLTEVPENTEQISFFYIYVNGEIILQKTLIVNFGY